MVRIAHADTITVGPTPGPGIDYTSIQEAIDAASPGDVIEVLSGTYYENVDVSKQLTLAGVGDPVVDAVGPGSAITLNADGCTIEGFEVSGIKLSSDNNIIRDNTATDNADGIRLDSSSGNTIEDNTATGCASGISLYYSSSGNTISGNTANDNFAGIELYSSSGNTIEGNTANNNTFDGISLWSSSSNAIEGNTANGNSYNGIFLSSSSSNTVTSNTATGNNYNGISLSYSSSNAIEGNTANGNSYNGIDLSYSSSNAISGNTANGNTRYGIGLWSSNGNTIEGNTAKDNNDPGIYLFDSGGNTIEGNTAIGNGYSDVYLYSSSGNTIYLNTLGGAYLYDSTNLWNSTEPLNYAYKGTTFTNYFGNRWSYYGGTDDDKDGIGDTPYPIWGDADNYPLVAEGSEILYAKLNKTSNLSSGAPFTKVLFTIKVFNTGQANLDSVTVQDELPSGLEYVSSKPEGNLVGDKVTWTFGPLASKQSESIELVAHINGEKYGPLENKANFTAINTTAGSVVGNDTDIVTALRAGIEVNKTLHPESQTRGAPSTNVTFSIKVKNTGEAGFVSVTVEDLLPKGLDYVSDDSGVIPDQNGNLYTWSLGGLASSDSVSFNITAHINGEEYGDIVNTANVTGKPEHGDQVEDSDAMTVTALRPGIDVNKTLHPESPTRGAPPTNVTFSIKVKNTGEADFVSVTLEDLLPKGLDYVSDDSGLTPDHKESLYTWNLGRLNSSESISFNLTARINGDEYGDLANRVNATGKPEHGDQVEAGDAEIVTAIRSGIDMEMTADPELVALFSDVTFTINVTNTGEIALDPVVLVDGLFRGMTCVSADPEPNEIEIIPSDPYFIAIIQWDNVGTASLEPGNSTILKLIAKIDGDAKGRLINMALATGCPLNGDNVSCFCSAEVYLPGISVTKTADKKEYNRGEEIVYTIVVENLADVPIYDVVVRDVFDRGVEFVSADPMPDSDGVWSLDMIQARGTATIKLVVRVPKQDFEFDMGSGVSGEGFVNVANDYSTTLQPYEITNRIYVTSMNISGEFSDFETVSVLGDPGTELETREHGSGLYESEEHVRLRTENKSISMEKDVSAAYATTTLGLYNNRTATYSSKWTEEAHAKNRVTGASMSESYRRATSIDRASRFFLDENESAMEIEAEFDGMGHVGFLKMPTDTPTTKTTPIFESREDYVGSFKVLGRTDEYGSAVSSEKAASGAGQVVVDKRVGDVQRSYESGAGTYDTEEIVETSTNYIAKDITLVHDPTSQSLTEDIAIDSLMKWKEGMYSKNPGTSYIGEEYTSITELDKETVARGLREMDTDADFSGRARYRAVLEDEVDIDEQYEGDYSVERRVIFTGVAKYDRPHLNVTKTLVGGVTEETLPWGYNEAHLEGEVKTRDVATYTISIENDGNKALGPVYVQDLFPSGSIYIEASLRPSELADNYANWTLLNIGIGDAVAIQLKLDVSEYSPSELVNRVEVWGRINNGDEWVSALNFSALEVNWLTCCPNETVSVTKTAEVDPVNDSVVRYRVEIKNDDDVTRVATVTDRLPEGMELVESSTPFASYDGDVVVWNLVEVPASGTAAIEFSALAPETGGFSTPLRWMHGPSTGPSSSPSPPRASSMSAPSRTSAVPYPATRGSRRTGSLSTLDTSRTRRPART